MSHVQFISYEELKYLANVQFTVGVSSASEGLLPAEPHIASHHHPPPPTHNQLLITQA